MDHFYAFLIFAVLLVLEQLARQSWLALYYRVGIPVWITRRKLAGVAPGQHPPETLDPPGLAKALQAYFKTHPELPALRFKALAARRPDRADIAFHETLFEPRAGSRYLPVLHSLARLRPERGEVSITASVDWYVLFVLFYLVLSTLSDPTFLFVGVLVLIIFALSALAQVGVNGRVADLLASGLPSTQPQ